MNKMCVDCPRLDPSAAIPADSNWYDSPYCHGSESEAYTGCIRKPFHPGARLLGLVYDIDSDLWLPKATQEAGES